MPSHAPTPSSAVGQRKLKQDLSAVSEALTQWQRTNGMMKVAMMMFASLPISLWIIGSTLTAFNEYNSLGGTNFVHCVVDVYEGFFGGTFELPAVLDVFIDPTVLWSNAWTDFLDLWSLISVGAVDLVEISTVMTRASFGFSLLKLVVSYLKQLFDLVLGGGWACVCACVCVCVCVINCYAQPGPSPT